MKELTDTRQQVKIKYKIWDVVICIVISCLCGMKTWEEIHDFVVMKYEFFRQFLKMLMKPNNLFLYLTMMLQ